MIQRIQTLFVLAVIILSSLMLTGDLIVMNDPTGSMFSIQFAGLSLANSGIEQRLWPLSVLIAIVPILALITIFLFKNRRTQMRMVMLVLLLSLGTLLLGAFYVIMFDKKIPVTIVWKIKAVFPLISAILAWLAYRSILKDEQHVKSYDRLR